MFSIELFEFGDVLPSRTEPRRGKKSMKFANMLAASMVLAVAGLSLDMQPAHAWKHGVNNRTAPTGENSEAHSTVH